MEKNRPKLTGPALKAHQVTGKAGGDARAANLTPERRKEIASIAAAKRWEEYRKRKANR